MSEEKKYAMLIDSDNISAKYIDVICDELAGRGQVTVRRIFGDWAKNVNGWNRNILLRYAIVPIQQYAYTTGKNATDSAMIIDAMDLLYTANIDGFCLVSSDSDFTRLATRLRESGKEVIGMGENKTPEAFIKACTSFKLLDSLIKEDAESSDEQSQTGITHTSGITDIKSIQKAIYDIIDANDDKNKVTHVGEIGSRLQNRYPDFDVRNYGYSKLTTFINEEFKNFEVISSNRQSHVRIKDITYPKHEVEEHIREMLSTCKNGQCNMGQVNQELKNKIKSFSIKKYGYSKFSSFLKSFDCFIVNGSNVSLK